MTYLRVEGTLGKHIFFRLDSESVECNQVPLYTSIMVCKDLKMNSESKNLVLGADGVNVTVEKCNKKMCKIGQHSSLTLSS